MSTERMVNETIVLVREEGGKGKRIVPPIGKRFKFTAEEIKQIEAASETAISKVAEGDETELASEADATVTEPPKGKKAPTKDLGDL